MNGLFLGPGVSADMLYAMIPGLTASFLLLRVAKWRIFVKAGFPGWKSLVPFYEGYLTFRIALRGWMYPICVIATCGAMALMAVPGRKTGMLELCSVIIDFTAVGLRIAALTFLAEKFGRGTIFMTGIVVFTQFFLMWLAFDRNSVYRGNPAENLPPGKGYRPREEMS